MRWDEDGLSESYILKLCVSLVMIYKVMKTNSLCAVTTTRYNLRAFVPVEYIALYIIHAS